MPEWDRSTGPSTSWSSSTGWASAPHLNMVELGKHGRNRTNVWDYASVNSMRGSRREDLALHPTVKPVGLVADAIKDVTTTWRSGARSLSWLGHNIARGRARWPTFSRDRDRSEYVDVALERWSAQTGLEPRLKASKAETSSAGPIAQPRIRRMRAGFPRAAAATPRDDHAVPASANERAPPWKCCSTRLVITTHGEDPRDLDGRSTWHRTLRDAFAGKRMAMREVLKWIITREAWLKKMTAISPMPELQPFLSFPDPDNADEALVILGIADHDPERAKVPTGFGTVLSFFLSPGRLNLGFVVCASLLPNTTRRACGNLTRDSERLDWS